MSGMNRGEAARPILSVGRIGAVIGPFLAGSLLGFHDERAKVFGGKPKLVFSNGRIVPARTPRYGRSNATRTGSPVPSRPSSTSSIRKRSSTTT